MQNPEIVGLDGAGSGKDPVLGFSVQTERLTQTRGLPSAENEAHAR